MNIIPVQTESGPIAPLMPRVFKPLPSGIPSQPSFVKLDFRSALGGAGDTTKENQKLVEALASSNTFRDYQRAFGEVTGMPLALRPLANWQLAQQGNRRQNSFCASMSQSNHSCAACLQTQEKIRAGVNGVPCTMKCALGIQETAVGVKIGGEIIGYLQTGQIFFKPPTSSQTNRVLKQLEEWGVPIDRPQAAADYQRIPVVQQATYQATISLLQFFAAQLGVLANQIVLQERTAEPEQITRARRFIEANFHEELSLATVARQAGISLFYFCKTFRKVTGMHFTQYVTRVRVEKAKQLLLNHNYRVSEIAFEVGFQSLTHFNRVFKTIAGRSPTDYREHVNRN